MKGQPGSVVNTFLERGGLMIRPARRKKYTLPTLLDGITKKNLHGEVTTGDPVGREAWSWTLARLQALIEP